MTEQLKMKVRNEYQELGVNKFYEIHKNDYSNPHEEIIKSLLQKNIKTKNYKILDLCAGSGEVTRSLLELGFFNIKGCDPYTSELYKRKTGKECFTYDFKDIANGKLNEDFDLIICSFALHLAEKSLLPNILFNLKAEELIILTPHKKPEINIFYELTEEIYESKVRFRRYKRLKIS